MKEIGLKKKINLTSDQFSQISEIVKVNIQCLLNVYIRKEKNFLANMSLNE